jgi:hypothetical protein
MFDLVERLAREVDCFDLRFDKSGKVAGIIS